MTQGAGVKVMSHRIVLELGVTSPVQRGATISFPIKQSYVLHESGQRETHTLTLQGEFTAERDVWAGEILRLEADAHVEMHAFKETDRGTYIPKEWKGPLPRTTLKPRALKFREVEKLLSKKAVQYDAKGNISEILEVAVSR